MDWSLPEVKQECIEEEDIDSDEHDDNDGRMYDEMITIKEENEESNSVLLSEMGFADQEATAEYYEYMIIEKNEELEPRSNDPEPSNCGSDMTTSFEAHCNNDNSREQRNSERLESCALLCCPYCNHEFYTQADWRCHLGENHGFDNVETLYFDFINGKAHCKECKQILCGKNSWYFEHHKIMHLPYRDYLKCKFCVRRFYYKKKLYRHVRRSHNQGNKYYKLISEMNKMMCLKCGKYLNGLRIANIRRHYKLIHKEIIDSDQESESISEAEIIETAKPPSKKCKIDTEIITDMDKNKFLLSCVGLFAVKNIPLNLFESTFFKALIAPFEEKFCTNVNAQNIIDIMEVCSKNIQKMLIKAVKNRKIALKIDIVRMLGRLNLVLNVQYMMNFKMHINTLGIIQLHKRNIGNLKDELIKNLKLFHINMEQVYLKTTDNGFNVAIVNNILQEFEDMEFSNEINIHQMNTEGSEKESTFEALVDVLSVEKSAASFIQLAAEDVLVAVEANLIDCRNAVMKLRKSSIIVILDIPTVFLDRTTSWSSTYEMLKSLVKLRDYSNEEHIKTSGSFKDIDWNFVNDFLITFSPLINFTKKLKNDQYIVGDFYRDWLTCELELEDLIAATSYSKLLHEAMQRQKFILLQNEAFLAALYLDPRFTFENSLILSEDQKKIAVNHLLKTFETIKTISDTETSRMRSQHDSNSDFASMSLNTEIEAPSTSRDAYARLEERLNKMMAAAPTEKQRTFKQKLNSFVNGRKLPLNTDVLLYLQSLSLDDDLKNVLQVALAVPITQSTADNASIALFILNRLKPKLTDETINSLLLTKLNFELVHSNIEVAFIDLNGQ